MMAATVATGELELVEVEADAAAAVKAATTAAAGCRSARAHALGTG